MHRLLLPLLAILCVSPLVLAQDSGQDDIRYVVAVNRHSLLNVYSKVYQRLLNLERNDQKLAFEFAKPPREELAFPFEKPDTDANSLPSSLD